MLFFCGLFDFLCR